jgi:hypothetical protein
LKFFVTFGIIEGETVPATAPIEETAPGEETTKEVMPAEVPVPVEEVKSFFAKFCGCMGGSAAKADTDTKDKPTAGDIKKVVDAEKEELAAETPVKKEEEA